MPKILIADDELAMREMLALACRLDGHEVHQAFDTASALSQYVQVKPDLMILDLSMPGGGGTEVVHQLRLSGQRMCPIVVVTGYLDSVPQRTRDGLGAYALIEKPFNMDTLRDAVRRGLDGKPR
jgi:DNA-binding response OmpR family regulator